MSCPALDRREVPDGEFLSEPGTGDGLTTLGRNKVKNYFDGKDTAQSQTRVRVIFDELKVDVGRTIRSHSMSGRRAYLLLYNASDLRGRHHLMSVDARDPCTAYDTVLDDRMVPTGVT